jgi:hypothetical protein
MLARGNRGWAGVANFCGFWLLETFFCAGVSAAVGEPHSKYKGRALLARLLRNALTARRGALSVCEHVFNMRFACESALF